MLVIHPLYLRDYHWAQNGRSNFGVAIWRGRSICTDRTWSQLHQINTGCTASDNMNDSVDTLWFLRRDTGRHSKGVSIAIYSCHMHAALRRGDEGQ
jgi:hypothetical protein